MKAEVGKVDIKKLVNFQMGLNNLRTKVDDLYVGKLKTAPVDLKEANKDILKKTVYNRLNTEVNDSKEKNSDATILIQINQ